MRVSAESELVRGRCFTISGTEASQVEQAVQGCLTASGFHARLLHTSNTTTLIVGRQRAGWFRVLASAFPQRIAFEIQSNSKDGGVHLRYDEQLAPWYLTILVAVAAIMTPFWFDSMAMIFRFAAAPTQTQEFHALQIWVSGIVGVVFVRLMLASGAGTTSMLLEDIRSRLRHLGAGVDQQQTGTITTKLLISLLFMFHLLAVMLLGVFSVRSPMSLFTSGKPANSLVAMVAIALLLVIMFAIVKGTLKTVRPIGGEERFAMVATGVSLQVGVIALLALQLGFLLLGQTDDEVWAIVFRVVRFLEMDDGQVRAAGLEHLSRHRFEIGFNMVRIIGHTFLMMAAATVCVGIILVLRSVRLAPFVRRMCERVHVDIETDYGRAAASGEVFRKRSRRSFLLAWSLSAAVIAAGLFGLLRFAITSFQFRYAGRTPDATIGAVDATANVINLLVGIGEHSPVGPFLSRVFFCCWATVMLLPLILSLLHGRVSSRRRRHDLVALSESLPAEAAELNREFKEMVSSAGLVVRLAISPGHQPRAAAHRMGLLRPHKFVQLSQRCLKLLNAEEQKALVAHELGHHLRGHCQKHNIMQWLGRLTYVGGTYVTSMEDSYGFELQADRAAVEQFDIDPAVLRKCLMKMRADAVVQRLRETNAGLGVLPGTDSPGRVDVPHSMGFPGWRIALRDWYALVRTDAEIAYWHPSVGDRIHALDESCRHEEAT